MCSRSQVCSLVGVHVHSFQGAHSATGLGVVPTAPGLSALVLPLAAFTPRPFLSLVRDFRALGSLDRARFAVLAGQPVGPW